MFTALFVAEVAALLWVLLWMLLQHWRQVCTYHTS
jgi:hypothetical protein